MRIIRAYLNVNLVTKLLAGFVLGGVIGGILWYASAALGAKDGVETAMRYCSPFGTVFVNMLRMIVIPIIFFSLVVGSSSLALEKLGKVGIKIIVWYFSTMLLAAVLGVFLARLVNPGAGAALAGWQDLAARFGAQSADVASKAHPGGLFQVLQKLLFDFFQNPFHALATANFLGVIMFSILFGISLRTILEKGKDSGARAQAEAVIHFFEGCNQAMFRIVDFVLQYAPIGVFFLTMVIFSVYGVSILGPYVKVCAGVGGGILGLIFVVYPVLIFLFTGQNPFPVIYRAREAMLMAFVTRSSGATLPVTIKVSTEELKVHPELASFSLPLGATINMDGVCVHLPMFVILATNMFGISLGFGDMAVIVITTVVASIGAGGVPGGSLMLLFIILEAVGCTAPQTAVIVALAVGINPILDMFETMSNVTGDILCTYVVAYKENLIDGGRTVP